MQQIGSNKPVGHKKHSCNEKLIGTKESVLQKAAGVYSERMCLKWIIRLNEIISWKNALAKQTIWIWETSSS